MAVAVQAGEASGQSVGESLLRAYAAGRSHKNRKRARGNIEWTRLIHTQAALQALSLTRSDLQAVCHFEDRRQDAEYN